MKTLQVLALIAFASAGAVFAPGDEVAAMERDMREKKYDATALWLADTGDDDARPTSELILPLLGPEAEGRIAVPKTGHAAAQDRNGILVDSNSATLAFAAAALAAPMFAAITLVAARGLHR